MHLISTVIVATSYETSVANAEAYLCHMKAYRALLQDMFPEYKCLPNHHMAMHISEYLLMFRPVQNWWTFPFERAIGTLERISTNYKAGACGTNLSLRSSANMVV
ncbi:hypothetical protein EDD18DRAFT_1078229 [Armillaria luteobubalina]|uniref:DUF4218 domain-containing protein n=1 Tax=Armillaria luteobubalina TaxID=153913 RepID=A0AA39TL71_9AGAR|nr:hypothetical protein EDD18DRAFT_1078229 [Armillaria luteobubalina]